MRVMCLSGSASPQSQTRALVDHVRRLLEARGHSVLVWDLLSQPLPLADPIWYGAQEPHPDGQVREFIGSVAAAGAVVLATPAHHASYSGLLKNALDHLSCDAFSSKAVGLVSNGGGIRGASLPCEHLRSVVKALSGWATPTQVATGDADYAEEGLTLTLRSEAVMSRCEDMVEELMWFAQRTGP